MSEEFYKMDLHIHTPASKCYTGAKNDEEYFEILRSAHKQNLDIIAFTDHNTLFGYEHLFVLKNELLTKRNILSEFQDTTSQINDALNECNEKLSLFENIFIIPGVEITLNPGIHMLVLSTPENLHILSELLDSIGYTIDKRGSDSDIEINIDVKNFLQNPKLNNFIVIAPHIDSNKGIFNSLSGQFRGEIMRSPIITAFSCNALSQKDKIINLFNNDPNYKRDYVPAFINCSDAHNIDAIGKKYSYVKLHNLSFSEIKNAFLSPEGKISDTSDQRLEKDIFKLIEDEEPILISDLSLVNATDLSHYICAALNEGTNYIIIGISPEKKIIGIKKEHCDFKKMVNDAIDCITSQYMHLQYSTTIEFLGNGNNIIVIYMKSSVNCLWYTEDNNLVYILDNNTPIPATITQIESLVQENTLCEISKLEEKNSQTISSIGTQLLSITNTIEKHELIQDILLIGIPLLSIYSLTAHTSTKIAEDMYNLYFNKDNGLSNGNLYFVTKNQIRLNDTILRYSCPTATIPENILASIDSTQLSSDSIIISQYGGTHITTCNNNIIGKETDYLILVPKTNETLSPYTVLAWLKSSLFTWFVYKRYNTTNIYLPEILREIIVPDKILADLSDNLQTIVQDILALEVEFLSTFTKDDICVKCQKCTDDRCLKDELLKKHNELVGQKTGLLDQLIFNAFCVDESKQIFIKEDLEAANIYNII